MLLLSIASEFSSELYLYNRSITHRLFIYLYTLFSYKTHTHILDILWVSNERNSSFMHLISGLTSYYTQNLYKSINKSLELNIRIGITIIYIRKLVHNSIFGLFYFFNRKFKCRFVASRDCEGGRQFSIIPRILFNISIFQLYIPTATPFLNCYFNIQQISDKST